MSLKIEQHQAADGAPLITLVSDDLNAENLAVGDCFEGAEFPELAEKWNATEMNDDGELRVDFPSEEWVDLQEALEIVDLPEGMDLAEEVRQVRLAHTGSDDTE